MKNPANPRVNTPTQVLFACDDWKVSEGSEWPEQWYAIASAEQQTLLTEELLRELCVGHVLWKKHVDVIARRVDKDDFLVRIAEETPYYAEVHLTWAQETDSRWPPTQVFQSLEDWRQQCHYS